MRTGRCQCGAVSYEIAGAGIGSGERLGAAETLYVCHCLECRRQSASAFGLSLEVPKSAFRLTAGELRRFPRDTDSGGRLACDYCADCGSRLRHEAADRDAPTVTVKAGTLDSPVDIAAAIHIWTARRMPGIAIPEGALRYPGEPPG